MPGDFEIAGVFARKITGFGENSAIEVRISLNGGAIGRAVVSTGNAAGNFTAVLRSEEDVADQGKLNPDMVEYVNTVLNAALKSRDAYNQEEVERLLLNADESGSRFREYGLLSAMALAASRARTAQMRTVNTRT